MRKSIFIILALLMGILIISCIRSMPKFYPPADHTISLNARLHKDGLYTPWTNCTSCHGTNLTGSSGPSCYNCHEQRW